MWKSKSEDLYKGSFSSNEVDVKSMYHWNVTFHTHKLTHLLVLLICGFIYVIEERKEVFVKNLSTATTKKTYSFHVNKYLTNDCEITRSEYIDLKNELNLKPLTPKNHHVLQIDCKFKEHKKVIRAASLTMKTDFKICCVFNIHVRNINTDH